MKKFFLSIYILLAGSVSCAQAQSGDKMEAFTCLPVDATIFSDRIHVRCAMPYKKDIYFFASPMANREEAKLIFKVITSAMFNNSKLIIDFNPEESGQGFSCRYKDCRVIKNQ